MKVNFKISLLASVFAIVGTQASAEEAWNLQKCMDYAMEKSIDMQKGAITILEGQVDTKLAKAQWQPSLNFSTSHTLSNSPWPEEGLDKTSYNGNYNLNASWTVFNGFKRKYNIKKQLLQERIDSVNVDETEENVRVLVVTYYIQVLYAVENLKTKQSSLEVAEAEYDRSKNLYEAGSISKSDFAQIEAQYAKERYQLVVAENDLTEAKLNLKLLLRLDDADMDVYTPEISEETVLVTLPTKAEAYDIALQTRPDVRAAELEETMSDLNIKVAKSGYYPNISLHANVGTGHNSAAELSTSEQVKQNFGESVGVTLSYSILDNRNRKSEKQKAQLEKTMSSLTLEKVKDDLKKLIETSHNDAVAAQQSYVAAKVNEEAMQTSYELTSEKYSLGAKTPFEMLSEKNSLLTAQQETIQAKYTALLNIQLLNIYQGIAVAIE